MMSNFINNIKNNKFTSYNYNMTYFLSSISNIQQLPYDTGYEIAFIGRSNSGKSSVLNALTNINNLSRTSKIPGCTKLINIFQVTSNIRLLDLPGYGYNKINKNNTFNLNRMIVKYLNNRHSLKGLVILMDIRHPMSTLDHMFLKLAVQINISVLLLLNKIDKLSNHACQKQLKLVRNIILDYNSDSISIEIFSSVKKKGVHQLQHTINNWLNYYA